MLQKDCFPLHSPFKSRWCSTIVKNQNLFILLLHCFLHPSLLCAKGTLKSKGITETEYKFVLNSRYISDYHDAFQWQSQGCLTQSRSRRFCCSFKQLIEGLGKIFRGNHGSESEVQFWGEDIRPLCGTGTDYQDKEQPAATIVWDHWGTVGKTNDFPWWR